VGVEEEAGLGKMRGVVLVGGAALGVGFDEDGLVMGFVGRRVRGGGDVEDEEDTDEDESLVSSSSELLLLSSSVDVSP